MCIRDRGSVGNKYSDSAIIPRVAGYTCTYKQTHHKLLGTPCERFDPKTNYEGAVTCRQVRAQAVKVQPYGDVNATRIARAYKLLT